MKPWKALSTAIVLFSSASLAHAAPISLQDVTNFTASGTNVVEDYDGHGRGAVNRLDGLGDWVKWTHNFEFSPPAETILSATLSLTLYDDDKDYLFCLWGCEFGIGYGEDGTWDIGEIDTGVYQYDLEIASVMDGSYTVKLASLGGDFFIKNSTLDIEYIPVPEPGTLALLSLGLLGLGAARRRKA